MQINDDRKIVLAACIESFNEYEREVTMKNPTMDFNFSFADFAEGFERCLEMVRKGEFK